ncbi:hypothetical protein OF83DRAFT_1054520 [Amylostereum chailletii]|nr:hypothetical protein OF83DRAFT_1054520 [Amylostereum chailletii]
MLKTDPLSEPIGIIGAGVAGLITAHTFLRDGFSNVEIVTRDASVGGTWARGRVYPGVVLNNVHDEYRLSAMPMRDPGLRDGRLTAGALTTYFEDFAARFGLMEKVLFGTEVMGIGRGKGRRGWAVDLKDLASGTVKTVEYSRVVLCTGGCSAPKIPESLSAASIQLTRTFFPYRRFLHTTWLGGKIVHGVLNTITWLSFKTLNIPPSSPLRNAPSVFWSIRLNDEGTPRSNSFFSLVNAGKIALVSPARAESFGADGRSLTLSNGDVLPADAVVLATGHSSSWSGIFDRETMDAVGLSRHEPEPHQTDEWNYTSLVNPPPAHPTCDQWSSSIYRGLVPAKNIACRDLAVNGAIFSKNIGYSCEVSAHWIASYFRGDPMRLPQSAEEALAAAAREGAWTRKRYPDMLLWASESYSSAIAFFTWPQVADEMLEDMGLRSGRSGGGWLTWAFKVISVDEIGRLREERAERRVQL